MRPRIQVWVGPEHSRSIWRRWITTDDWREALWFLLILAAILLFFAIPAPLWPTRIVQSLSVICYGYCLFDYIRERRQSCGSWRKAGRYWLRLLGVSVMVAVGLTFVGLMVGYLVTR